MWHCFKHIKQKLSLCVVTYTQGMIPLVRCQPKCGCI